MFQSKLIVSSQIGELTNNVESSRGGKFGRGERNPRGREEEIWKKNNHKEKDCWNIDKPQCYNWKGVAMSKRIVTLKINTTSY